MVSICEFSRKGLRHTTHLSHSVNATPAIVVITFRAFLGVVNNISGDEISRIGEDDELTADILFLKRVLCWNL